MIKVLFVCHGNICRSTMAESVFTHIVNRRGLSDKFYINSAATSTDEIGSPPHFGTANKLKSLEIPLVPHRAVQITNQDFKDYDYIIAMDTQNIKNLAKFTGFDAQKTFKLLSFAGLDRDIADPWYSGDFDKTYDDILKGLSGFLTHLKF
ncbi:low molecular weight protein-tyrosine-phosphatase [Campylobacter gastrosuis]|uniref:protein-tyrosine-phosphatase n=1 Tax=Campylobacter gastrosuis TaxID=2974576 RepID=A0ABT7HNS8_9BACT|nr:low molecular weight protein-tyrosine-phosphatase [Campylobacter gastrosuis]MDL0088278.1 low molecular weight phosphotyrosine protein phosphatase [Campylobacter gastrosuis]